MNTEDFIDFPVSSDWLDFYHERGLTPRSSGRLSRVEKMLLERIEKLEEQIAQQQKILVDLVQLLASKRHTQYRTNTKGLDILKGDNDGHLEDSTGV